MAKRGRKPKERKGYFYEKEENAIVQYINEKNIEEKNRIFNTILYPALTKMIESIIRRYKLFVPDEDYVYYTTPEDLYEKVDYYLEHDERRKQIAICGYQKVKEKHTYDIRVQEILSKLV